jgi:SIR2-like domain
LNDVDKDRLQAALRSTLTGTATLFVGAGVSFLSTNSGGQPLPNGGGLSDIIHDKLGIERRKHGLASIADYYRTKYGASDLMKLLSDSLIATSTDDRLVEFYNAPWRRIYTTNYDQVIARARNTPKTQLFSHIDKPVNVNDGAIIHLNGNLEKAVAQSIDGDLTLTDSSYGITNLTGSSWMELFLSDLRLSKFIIFVGYSLADLDIARALIVDEKLRRKCFIFVGPDADEVEISRLGKYGSVSNEGIDFLFEQFRSTKTTFTSPPPESKLLHSQELNLEGSAPDKPAAAILFDQLVYGQIPINAILAGKEVTPDLPFLVNRVEISAAMVSLSNGSFRDMFITGELASGKTMGLVQIAKAALESDMRVFWLNDGRNFEQDLAMIARLDGHVLLVCDGYVARLEALKTYIKIRKPQQKLVLSERTATHELVRSGLESEPNFGPVRDVSLTRLSTTEVQGFDRLVHFAGLWGENAGLSPAGRERLISIDLQSSLYRILLEIIKSEKVQSEIKRLLSPILQDEDALRFFLTAFIVNIFAYNFWINDWQRFYKIENIRKLIANHIDAVGHFINLDSAQIYLRSGILSRHILRSFADDQIILDCLIDMYDRSSQNSFSDEEFSKISFELRHYNHIEPLFSNKEKLHYLRRYFQEIRGFPKTESNSDYWLQFGIAMSIHGDHLLAGEAFKTAYAKERAKDKPNLTKIDNYFARFELESATSEPDSSVAFGLAQSGANKLMKQTFLENNRHYPFKTGRSFSGIAANHYESWDQASKNGFKLICKKLRERAMSWRIHNKSDNRDVNFLISDMDQLQEIFAAADTEV